MAALLLTALPSGFTQEKAQDAPQQPAPETTLRSQSNLVLIPALVKDQQGGIVYGLQTKDFIVEDDGVEQTARLDEAPEGQPVSLVVAIQTGRRANYEFPRVQGLKSMLDPLFSLGTARVALVEFGGQVELTRNFTKDASLFDADLSNLQPGDGGAAILDAVNYSVNLLKNEPEGRQRVLLLISETRDHGSHAKIDSLVAAIGQANTVMYALAFSPALSNILDTGRGTNKNEEQPTIDILDLAYRTAQAMRKNVPSAIASMTGGEYELFATRKKFEVRMNDFTNHLHSRYLLSIAPKSPHAGLHQIRVRLKDAGNSTVLARGSYWAEGTK
ncbi:MAG TPA: VWA domain-containing protein [Candidatus Sulfotelmatobacter sp.]|jgi:VWFA-related protein|nr:VWA domain-containing protein [Candidatus Sulfotelmatobacter sp.]